MKPDLGAQLAMLKATTERMGVLHEAQLLQVRNYPILMDGIVTAQATVDQDGKHIVYDCKASGKFRKTDMRLKMFKKIVWMLQQVVWTDVIVEFNVDGKPIYDSRIDRDESKSTGAES